MAVRVEIDNQVAYWQGELNRAKKRFEDFWTYGDSVVDVYRQQKADGGDAMSKDKYNILYSSTETIRPNLFAQSPIPRVALRSKDTASDETRVAAMVLENCIKYVQKEEDFDELMDSVVEDYLLPGMGTAWVRYDAIFGEDELLDEMVKMEYVYWQDFLCGVARTWKEIPWVARRCWMTKEDATKRFSKEIADALKYSPQDSTSRERENPAETAEVWEIWDKKKKQVYWYADSYKTLLDTKEDPLKLKRFFPCPRPIRAIFNTRTFVPRPLYSQYKSQAETLNVLTKRIRLLGEALRVVGLFDGSQQKLADILSPNAGNRMIAVDSWALFAQNGGINGSVQWVPIDVIVKVLNELLKAREICKQEIYEITGFSDIVRGVSKASETLGAQNIKANWAGARVKKMQAEIQRFARDLLALAGELIAEHCQPTTLAMFSGVTIPDPEQVKTDPAMQGQVKTFMDACGIIKSDLRRTAVISIETDSTLMADDQAERADRSQFLAAAGAFLQQAVPAMEATPELGPLLGAMLMFTVRTFPSSRVIEDEFEKVQQAMAGRAENPDKDGKKAEAAAKAQQAQADAQQAQADTALKTQELQAKAAADQAKVQAEGMAEQNRHAEKMAELEIRRAEVEVRKSEAATKADLANTAKFTAMHDAGLAELAHEEEVAKNVRDYELEEKGLEVDHRKVDQAEEATEVAAETAAKAQEATVEAAKAKPKGDGA